MDNPRLRAKESIVTRRVNKGRLILQMFVLVNIGAGGYSIRPTVLVQLGLDPDDELTHCLSCTEPSRVCGQLHSKFLSGQPISGPGCTLGLLEVNIPYKILARPDGSEYVE